MATYTKTNFNKASAHVRDACGISLTANLTSGRWHTLRAWSILAPLMLLWRYAQQMDGQIKVYDMVASGHLSHKSGTDLDFGYENSDIKKRAIHQVRVIKDMLELNEALMRISNKFTVFRLGYYFDRFDNDKNLKAMEKATDKEDKFEDLYKHRKNVSSMHLGLRYDFTNKIYHGSSMSSGKGKYVFWGQGSKGFHRGKRWRKVFRDMEGNLAPGQISLVAYNTLRDLEALDQRDPTIAHGRDPQPYHQPFDSPSSESVWA